MAVSPTPFSRVSVGFMSSTETLADYDAADTGAVFSVTGDVDFNKSNLSLEGNLTATGGAFIGDASAVNELVAVSSGTAAVSLGAITPLESSSVVTVGLSNATRGDTLFLTLDSIYQDVAANRDVSWYCSSSSTAGEVNVWGINSTLTAVTPTANTVVRITRINHPTYL